MARRLRHLFRQPDHFDWFSAYLDERGLQKRWRLLTVAFTLTLAAIPIMMLGSPTGPDHRTTMVVSCVASLVAAVSALAWLTNWPTRQQSTLFCLAAIGCIGATCLSQSSAYGALMGCTAFAVIGGFIAFFHNLALVCLSLAVAMACAVTSAVRLIVSTGDIPLALSAFLIVLGLNIGVPFGIHSLAHTLRSDLRSSGHDSLTGVLTRRAFYQSAYALLMRGQGTYLIVILIDLDDFKRLNDTLSHQAGDRALIEVGTVLRGACPETAVIGRVGGEEFVVAVTADVADPDVLADRLCRAIALTPTQVTASIGTAYAPLSHATTSGHFDLIDGLIHQADVAMYGAKRAGGNRVQHSGQGYPPVRPAADRAPRHRP
jgi:diguanylate cyclase (GGDEF)-like protein